MSTATVTVAVHDVALARAVSSEWIKFRTLRSTLATLGVAVVGFVVLGLVIAYQTGRNPTGLDPEDTAASATLQGYLLAQLVIGVLGVLFVSGEYSTGMIRSTLAAVPKRIPVVAAKTIVLSAVVLTTMVVTSVVTFLVAQLVLGHYGHGYSLSDPTAVRVAVGTGVYLTLIALLGSALGWLVRSTPGGITALVALILVVPVLFGQLLGTWAKDLNQLLPSSAGESFVMSLRADHTLAPWTGLAVLVAWVAVGLTAAAVLLRRRDA